MLGLSKFARLTVLLAKRLQQQQQLAAQILDVFVEHVMPHGAAVIIEATHLEEGPDAPRHVCHAAHGAFAAPGNHHLQVRPGSAPAWPNFSLWNTPPPRPPPPPPPARGAQWMAHGALPAIMRHLAVYCMLVCQSRLSMCIEQDWPRLPAVKPCHECLAPTVALGAASSSGDLS